MSFLLHILLLSFSLNVRADLQDPERLFLKELSTKKVIKIYEYTHPYLVSLTAVSVSQSPAIAAENVRKYLLNTKVPVQSHYSKDGAPKVDLDNLLLPKEIREGDQFEGLEKCSVDYCLMKLNTEKEKKSMEKSQNKLVQYHILIVDRVKRFLSSKVLLGYEERLDNTNAFKEMVLTPLFLKHTFPKSVNFLLDGFWNAGKAPFEPTGSFVRAEVVSFRREKLQPIFRIGEVFEFQEKGAFLFFEIHLYSNHYFDASAKTYEVLPFEKNKSLIVITDIMENDTLKVSSMVRFLYTGEIEGAISDWRDSELKRIRGE